jgi:thiopurine S-methyltransferase
MQHDFWHERWTKNQIAFHQSAVHPQLRQFWSRLVPVATEGVFVPMCGKTLDMWWLRDQGHPVLGVELSPLAVEAFFTEAELTPVRTPGALERWTAAGVTLAQADFFALRPEDVAGCRLIYDRGSLVALPPAMRQDYVKHLRTLFPQGARILLVTFDYPPAEMNGPPFAVTEEEVRGYYRSVELLVSEDVLDANPNMRQRGLTQVRENVYRVEI